MSTPEPAHVHVDIALHAAKVAAVTSGGPKEVMYAAGDVRLIWAQGARGSRAPGGKK